MRAKLVSLITGAAVLIALAVSAPSVAAPTRPEGPSLGPGVARQIANMEDGEVAELIVTAHSFEGLRVLDAVGAEHRRLRTVPIAFATLTAHQAREVATSPAIRSVWPRERLSLFLAESTQLVGADRVEQLLGVRGENVAVAVVDTGIDATHPDLPWHEKVVANYEVAANPFDRDASLLVDLPDTDDDSHGTHVASTVAGNDVDGGHVHDGVAPGADLYGYSVNVGITIDLPRALAAFDDVIQKREDGVPIVAISNSWGGGPGEYNPADPLSVVTKAAYDAGISVVFAAGNDGQLDGELDTASSECTMPWVICVGAETKPGQLVEFSSRGRPPVETNVTTPDGDEVTVLPGNHDRTLGQALDVGVFRPTVTAPGVNIVAACAKSACGAPGDYQSLSGTSMATPHVSGVVALVSAARLGAVDELLSAEQVIQVLESTANPMPGWELWEAGAGEVDAYAAARAVSQPEIALRPPNFGARSAPLGPPIERQTIEGEALPFTYTTGIGYSEHTIDVPTKAAQLDLTLRWSDAIILDESAENLYMFAWRPGAEPNGNDEDRPDQEAWGLTDLENFRTIEVAYPQPGEWTVRVYGRRNAVTPYTLEAVTSPARRPVVRIGRAAAASADEVRLDGTASFPQRPGTGITRESIPGTTLPLSVVGEPVVHYLHGEVPEADKLFGLPYFDTEPPQGDPQFQTGGWYGNDAYAENFLLAYWEGDFSGTIQGDVPVKVWMSSQTEQLGGGLITFRLFDFDPELGPGEGHAVIAQASVLGAAIPPVPTPIEATMRNVAYTVPDGHRLVLQISASSPTADYFQTWYDADPFPSQLTLPVLEGQGGIIPRPSGLRATDLVGGGVSLQWEPVQRAGGYVVYRSDDPSQLGQPIGSVTENRFVDRSVPPARVAYYRVATVAAQGESEPSDVVYGIPVDDRIWVEVRPGRGPWEAASGRTSWTARLARAQGPGSDLAICADERPNDAVCSNAFDARARTWAGASIERTTVVSG